MSVSHSAPRKVDVVVVGAGPAGLVAAATAASQGLDTLLVEREAEIGSPVHTSGATAVQTMATFGIPESLYHPVPRWRICSPNEEAVFGLGESTACIIDVKGVYQHLGVVAGRSGARIVTGTTAEEVLIERGAVVGCRLSGGSLGPCIVESKVLIDASGYRASLSTQAGLHEGFRRFGVGAEYELTAPRCRQDEAVLVVGNRYAPSGYAWAFPWGDARVRLGVGVLHADTRADPRQLLSLFMEEAEVFKIDLRDATIEESHFGLIPSDGLASRLVADGIMAAGDSAGQASLVVGEGIRLSMVAGALAAEVAAQAIAEGHWHREALVPYERLFKAKYGKNLAMGHALNVRMGTRGDAEWDEKVRLLKSLPTPLVVDLLQSNFSIGNLTRWLALRPTLWPRAARYALRYALASAG
jgi:digeranylgeranylglycerophospholipid reductase